MKVVETIFWQVANLRRTDRYALTNLVAGYGAPLNDQKLRRARNAVSKDGHQPGRKESL